MADRGADPGSLQAATDAPTPEPQTSTPRCSARRASIALADLARLVGIVDPRLGASVPRSTTSWPSACDLPRARASRSLTPGGRRRPRPASHRLRYLRRMPQTPGTTALELGASSASSCASTRCARARRPAPATRPRRCRRPTSPRCCSRSTSATTSTNPKNPANDRLIFSKGHASPLVYGLFRAAGAISEEEFLHLPRSSGRASRDIRRRSLPWVDVATGSLGQGLPIGVGMALAGKRSTACRSASG